MAQAPRRPQPQRPNPRPNPAAKPVQKRPLSPEEKQRRQAKMEAMRRQKEERIRRENLRKERRKTLFRISFYVAIVFVVFYWIFVTFSIINRPNGNEDALPLYVFTEGKRKQDKIYPADEICVNGVKYLPVTFLEKYVAISQFGDHKTRSFLLCSSGEFATFYLNTEEGVINGEHFAIQSPSFLRDDVLYLPVDFYVEKMNCFQFGKNNPTYSADVLTFLKDVEPSFVYTPVEKMDPLPYDPAYKQIPQKTTVPETSTNSVLKNP